jgi:hypothetical protein
MARNPYVFLVGCPRSGTTLLQRMLDAHPRLAVTNEMDIGLEGSGGRFKKRWREHIGLTRDGFVTPTLAERLLGSYKFSRFDFEPATVRQIASSVAPLSYPDFISRLFDLYGEMRGKALAGDKMPMYGLWIGGLHTLWPQARFVHIIRDGRDVYQSMRSWRRASPSSLLDDPQADFRFGDYRMSRFKTWEQDTVVTLALWWKWRVLLARQDGHSLGSRLYHEVLYEDLVRDPVGTSKTICAFLEIPFSMRMVRYADGKTNADPSLGSKERWLPPTPGLRDWRTEMSQDAIERFEAAAGNLLDELGYERGATEIPLARLEDVASVAERFVNGLHDKHATVPRGLWNE